MNDAPIDAGRLVALFGQRSTAAVVPGTRRITITINCQRRVLFVLRGVYGPKASSPP